ncbi:MAG: TetR/AcrR family transcriptional regulator [Roseburia sp.]|nr:TetR/AcrR family transcriptional regulator [Roseburia sp.]
MNEKFFDLPREKQDRMINGALEVFSQNGFKHASTDDMVKAVGVSKGLWFHYFGSKAGLYVFVYEYSVKYILLELSTVIDETERDFFEMVRQIELARTRVSKSYPFMTAFIEKASAETDEEIALQTMEAGKTLQERLSGLIKNTEVRGVEDKARRERVRKLTSYTVEGLIKERTRSGAEPDSIYRELKGYLDFIKETFC